MYYMFTYTFTISVLIVSATSEIYTLSLHDALPISHRQQKRALCLMAAGIAGIEFQAGAVLLSGVPGVSGDRKSTRLNSSHRCISYAVFCLKKKKKVESKITE